MRFLIVHIVRGLALDYYTGCGTRPTIMCIIIKMQDHRDCVSVIYRFGEKIPKHIYVDGVIMEYITSLGRDTLHTWFLGMIQETCHWTVMCKESCHQNTDSLVDKND